MKSIIKDARKFRLLYLWKKRAKKVRKLLVNLRAHFKKYLLRYFIGISCIVLLVFWGKITEFLSQWIEWGKLTSAEFFSGVIAIVGIILLLWRTINQERQIKIQIQQRVDDRFTTAVNLLGSKESSARTGAIYSLHSLALDDKKYRNEIANILCSHIRIKTAEPEYQQEHSTRPSNEIQTAIDVLFRKHDSLYKNFLKNLNLANLSNAFLAGADFSHAYCQGADFSHAQCKSAIFSTAKCQEAIFRHAKCQEAHFDVAECQEASFYKAKCQEAIFRHAKCQKTHFDMADCQGANFRETQCQGAFFYVTRLQKTIFWCTQCQEANFQDARCQGAFFYTVQLQKAIFNGSKCQGAYFHEAQCQGAEFQNAQCQGTSFYKAQFQGANFYRTQFQGAILKEAQFQGARFIETQFQGISAQIPDEELQGLNYHSHYVSKFIQYLKDRIGKDTELDNIVFAGETSKAAINALKKARKHLPKGWCDAMQKIIEDNKDKTNTLSAGIETGILEDTPELQHIIKELEEIEQKRKKQFDSDDVPISK